MADLLADLDEADDLVEDYWDTVNDLADSYYHVREPGVYYSDLGKIYQVRWNKEKTALHVRLFNTITKRFRYAPGHLALLRPEQRLSLEQLIELSITLGICAFCGRTLTAAQSTARGIGPDCYKNYEATKATEHGQNP